MPQRYLRSKQILELAFKLRDSESREQLEMKFLKAVHNIYDDKSIYISLDFTEDECIPIEKSSQIFGYLVIPNSAEYPVESWEEWKILCYLLAEMMVVSKQIKKSRMMAAQLSKSEELYRLLTETATDVVFKIDLAEMKYEYMSPVSNKLLGFDHADLYKNPALMKTLLPEDWSDFFDKNMEKVEKGILVDYYEYPIIHHKTKELHWLHQSNDWIRDEKGKLIALQGRIENITERKQAEQKLKDNEQRYKKAQVMGQVGNWEYNPVTTHFWVSAESKRIYGFNPDIIDFGTAMVESCIPEKERVHQALIDLLERDKEYNLEYEVITYDKGELKTIQSIAEVERDETGRPLKVIGVIKDITLLKKSRLALLTSENKFRSIFEQSPIAIEIFNSAGKLVDVNHKTLELYGIDSINEVYGFDLWADPNITRENKEQLQKGEPVFFTSAFDFEKVKKNKLYKTSKSGIMYHNVYAIPLMKDGIINGYLVQIIDDTERKNSEKKLVVERNKVENYLNIADVILLSLDLSGNTTMINSKGCDLLGYAKNEILGKNWVENFVPVRIRKEVWPVWDIVTPQKSNENLVLTKAGEERLIEWHNVSISDEKGNVIGSLSSGLDITDRKRAEEELLGSKQRLQEAQALGKMGNWNINLNTGQVTGSLETKRIYGIPEKDGITTEATQAIHLLEYREKLDKALGDLIQFGKPYDEEFRLKKADSGEIIDVHSRAEYNKEKNLVTGIIQDVTENKKTLQALKESEEKFRALYDNAPLSYQSLNEDGTFRDINPTWLNTLGYKRDEVIGKNYADFLHPDWKAHFENNFPVFKKRGYISGVEFRIRHKNGSYVDIAFEGCIGYYPDGTFHQTYCVFKDITEQKQAELALRNSEEKFRKLYKKTPVMLHSIDAEGRIINVSDYWLEKMGYTESEVVGVKSSDFLTENSKKYAAEVSLPAYFKAGVCFDVPYQYVKKNGEVIEVLLSAISEKDKKGEFVQSLAVIIDITDRKKAELKLKESEERYHTLFQNTEEGIIIANSDDLNFEYANPAICKILGYSYDEILKLSIVDIHPEETIEFAKDKFHKLAVKEITGVKALNFIRKDGSTIFMDVGASIIKINGEDKLAGFFTDITERKLADEELAKHREHLEELVKERTKELEYKNAELERFNQLFVGREFRIKELRDKVKALEGKSEKQK